jgi:hypothetical protein
MPRSGHASEVEPILTRPLDPWGSNLHEFRAGVRKTIKRKVNKRARQGEATMLEAAVEEAPGIEAIADEVEALLEGPPTAEP